MPKDIYADLYDCEDNNRYEAGLQGFWTTNQIHGSCNACWHKDNRYNQGEKIFVVRLRSLEFRLCISHLRELVKQSRTY